MRSASLLLATGLLLLTLAPAPPARADEEPRAKQKERAFHLVKAAVAFQDEGQHELALEALAEAADLFGHPKILFYKARSLTALGHWQAGYNLWDRLMGHAALKEDQLVEVRDGWVRCKAALKEAKERAAATTALAPEPEPEPPPSPEPDPPAPPVSSEVEGSEVEVAPSPVVAPVDLRAPTEERDEGGVGLAWSVRF